MTKVLTLLLIYFDFDLFNLFINTLLTFIVLSLFQRKKWGVAKLSTKCFVIERGYTR